jgi:hypothetical protein
VHLDLSLSGGDIDSDRMSLLGAPPLYDASKKCLFWVIGYVRTKPIDRTSKMLVWTTDNLWAAHCRLQGFEYASEGRMKELTAEFPKFCIIGILLIG